MIYWAFIIAAILLSFERLTYYYISHYPERWAALCERSVLRLLGRPVQVLHRLFYLFKVVQMAVFLGWCALFSNNQLPLPTADALAGTIGGLLLLTGLVLNLTVFRRLGTTGVFYGAQLGHQVRWIEGFPFSLLKHPQYVGTLLSIWGFFLIMRFPHDDWIVLPLLETVYYAVGARHEV